MDFVIPKTKVEAYATLADRRFHDQSMFKYDMFLIGLVLCSDEEFEYRTCCNEGNFIYGTPCLCKYLEKIDKCNAGLKSCKVALQETFAMKWDDILGN